MGARSVMARAWSCLCRLLLFLIFLLFLLPPPAAPGQPAGECVGPGRACRPQRPRPGSLSRTAPFPLPRTLRRAEPPLSPLPGAIWAGSGSRSPSPALQGRPVGQRPPHGLAGPGVLPAVPAVPGGPRGSRCPQEGLRVAAAPVPCPASPACCCRGCCGSVVWTLQTRNRSLGSLPCHTAPARRCLFAPPPSRVGHWPGALPGSPGEETEHPPAEPREMRAPRSVRVGSAVGSSGTGQDPQDAGWLAVCPQGGRTGLIGARVWDRTPPQDAVCLSVCLSPGKEGRAQWSSGAGRDPAGCCVSVCLSVCPQWSSGTGQDPAGCCLSVCPQGGRAGLRAIILCDFRELIPCCP